MKSLRKIKENVYVQSAVMEWDTAEMYRQISAPTETVKGKEQAAQELLKEIEVVEQKKRVHLQVICLSATVLFAEKMLS